jgi:hypothetical protein
MMQNTSMSFTHNDLIQLTDPAVTKHQFANLHQYQLRW